MPGQQKGKILLTWVKVTTRRGTGPLTGAPRRCLLKPSLIRRRPHRRQVWGQKFTVKYKGKVGGDTIKGKS